MALLQLYLVLFSFSEEIGDDCLASCDHDSYTEQQSESEEEADENKLNKFKTTDSNQESNENDSELTKPESGTYDDKDIPTAEVSSLSLSSAHGKPESYSNKKHLPSKKDRRQDASKDTCSGDTIVQSVQVVFQEWCTQSTLEYLGLSVKTEAHSSFSEEKEIGWSFSFTNAIITNPPECETLFVLVILACDSAGLQRVECVFPVWIFRLTSGAR